MERESTIGLLDSLQDVLGRERTKRDEPLARCTTFKIGGPADLFYVATTVDELARAVLAARTHRLPYFVLGTGANVLIGDRGIRGLVIKNDARQIALLPGNQVRAASGGSVARLIAFAKEHALSGLEHFAGIPSSVGGALWQNLHFLAPERTHTVYIAECLAGATILAEDGTIGDVPPEYFQFGYDDSILHHRQDVVLSATLCLVPREVALIQQVIDANLRWRRERHPDLHSFPNAGSIFKKIEGAGAGRLIDQCGLKGLIIGGAQVSPRHANFIVNLGGATARDVLALVALCQARVRERFGLTLEMEIGRVGEF